MTLAEQAIEALATYGPGVAALAVAVRQWLTSRARLSDALASQAELAIAREQRLSERIDALEAGVVERDATIDVLRDLTQDCERRHREAVWLIERHEARMQRWESLLKTAGIDPDGDSDEWVARLGELIAGHAAHAREQADRDRLRTVSVASYRGGPTGTDG